MFKRLKNTKRYIREYKKTLNDYDTTVSGICRDISHLLCNVKRFKGELYGLYGSERLRFLDELETYMGEWWKRLSVCYSVDGRFYNSTLRALKLTYTPEYVAFVDGIRMIYPVVMKLSMALEDLDVKGDKAEYISYMKTHRSHLRRYFSELSEREEELLRKAYHWRAGQTDRYNRFAVKLKKAESLTEISQVFISLHEYNGPAYDYLIEEAGWGLNDVSFAYMEKMTEDDDVDVFEEDTTDDMELVF